MGPIVPAGVEVKNAFLLFGRMSVWYEGRASSTLEPGYYLFLRKPDGSTMVHGGDLSVPLNYQPAGSKLYQDGWNFTIISKNEQMKVEVYEVLNLYRPKDWESNRIVLIRTEKELSDALATTLGAHIPNLVSVVREYPTEHGPVDVVGIDMDNVHHLVEVKRHRISVSAAIQLRKYMDAVESQGHRTQGYLAAPSIMNNAQIYCTRKGYSYIRVQHREPPI